MALSLLLIRLKNHTMNFIYVFKLFWKRINLNGRLIIKVLHLNIKRASSNGEIIGSKNRIINRRIPRNKFLVLSLVKAPPESLEVYKTSEELLWGLFFLTLVTNVQSLEAYALEFSTVEVKLGIQVWTLLGHLLLKYPKILASWAHKWLRLIFHMKSNICNSLFKKEKQL